VRFAPFTLCLSAQGPRCTDPTIAPAFDGLKISVSRRVTFIDRSLLRSSFPGPRNEGFNRCLSPPGFPQCPTVRELRGALAPSTEMSRMTIYLAGLLEGDGRASHLAPNTDHLGGTADAHGARLTARRPLRAASVRSTSDSDRIGASERTDVKCHVWTAPAVQEEKLTFPRIVRVQPCIRPLNAAVLAAGPDVIR
jgi:hypothetical protein